MSRLAIWFWGEAFVRSTFHGHHSRRLTRFLYGRLLAARRAYAEGKR